MLSALFIFGASGFGDFEDAITNAIPIPSVTQILGIDNEFTDFLTGLIGTLYELLEDGIEALVDLVLSIVVTDDESFRAAFTSQFSGCAISIFFIVRNAWIYNTYMDTKSEGSMQAGKPKA